MHKIWLTLLVKLSEIYTVKFSTAFQIKVLYIAQYKLFEYFYFLME